MDFLTDDGVNIDDPLSFDFFGFDFDFKGMGERHLLIERNSWLTMGICRV
jgi:hypothetical protein